MGTRNNGKGVDNTKLGGAGFKVAKRIRRVNRVRSKMYSFGIHAKRW